MILREIYCTQYEYPIDMSIEEIEIDVMDRNEIIRKEKKSSRYFIPTLESFAHERRKWIAAYIDALIEPGAFKSLRNKKNNYSFNSKNELILFFGSIISEDTYRTETRREILAGNYDTISATDINWLRHMVIELYKAAGADDVKIKDAIMKFDKHFEKSTYPICYRRILESIECLQYYFSKDRVKLYSIEDFKYFDLELRNIVGKARDRAKQPIDEDEFEEFLEIIQTRNKLCEE